MICEYCHYYTSRPLKATSQILVIIRKKFKITKNIEKICQECYSKFKKAEISHIQNTMLFE